MKLIKYYLLMFRNGVQAASFGDVFKTVFFCSLSFFFMLGLYFGFYRLISYLDKIQYFGPMLIFKLLSLVFLTTFIMIIFSSLITSLNSLFFARELELLFILPISPRRIFLLKSFESFVYSSWMVLVVILPFLAALAKLRGLGVGFFAWFSFILVPYLIIPAFLGILLTMLLFYLFPSSRLRDIMFVLVIILGSSLYMLMRIMQPEKLVNVDIFQQVMQYMLLLQAPTAVYLPSWWLTEALRSFAVGERGDFYFYTALLFAVAILLVYITVMVADGLYYKSWNQARERSASMEKGMPDLGRKRIFKGLWAKEIILFFRSPEQWPQLILLGALIVVYLFSIYRLPIDTVYLKSLISFLNIGFAGFVLSAIILRFAFPAVSLEGRAFWLIKSFPLDIKGFVLSKWALYCLPAISIGVLLVGFSCYLLDVTGFVMAFSLLSMFFLSLGLVSLGIGFGAVFPRFSVSNIARIESSAGGIYFMITALFYVGLIVSLEAVLMQIYFYQKLKTSFDVYMPVVVAVLVSVAVCHCLAVFLPLYFGRRSLERYEIEYVG